MAGEGVVNTHYILEGREVKSASLMEWAQWFETADRDIAKTTVSDEVNVSTVFLGINHSFGDGPLQLFETMTFGGEYDQYQERYETWEQAEVGHKKAVVLAEKLTSITHQPETVEMAKGEQEYD